MKVTILCGISGAGKSTYINKRWASGEKLCEFSADHFFLNEAGEYQFDPKKLPEAHASCLRGFVEELQENSCDVAYVDNTNTTVAEIAPYAALALAYGCELEIVILQCDPEVAAKRNLHGVPLKAVCHMAERISRLQKELPPWWPVTTIGQQ